MISIVGDRDFKIVSLTPSVTLRVEVRLDEGEDHTSYYRGKPLLLLSFHCTLVIMLFKFAFYMFSIGEANVTLKDSIFQGSSPIRHAAELLAINKRAKRKLDAFVMVFTDGGPDHITYHS